jgi:peptide/nickel transport system substrate-binding protein
LALAACYERGGKRERGGKSEEEPKQALTTPALRAREPTGPADADAKVVLRLQAEPSHLNPMFSADVWATAVAMGDIYEGLMHGARPGSIPQPALAESVRVDGLAVRFTLRKGVLFHDGSQLEAADVMASVEAARASPLGAELDDLSEVSLEDDELVMRFRELRPDRLELFTRLPIMQAKLLRDKDAGKRLRDPVGTGALQFVEWRDEGILLRRFDDYWGQRARAKEVLWAIEPDRVRALHGLRSGALDVVWAVPVAEALAEAKEGKIDVVRRTLPAYTAALFNCERLPAALRAALDASVDRDTLVRELFAGHGAAAVGPFPFGSERHDPALGATPFDRASARTGVRASLKERQSLHLLVPLGSRTMERFADLWAADLRGVVQLRIERLPYAEMLQRVRGGDYEIALLSFQTSDSVDLFSLFHSSAVGTTNLARIAEPRLDELLVAARTRPTQSISRQIHRRLFEIHPMSFLTSDMRLGVVRSDIGGVGDTAPAWGARYVWRGKP